MRTRKRLRERSSKKKPAKATLPAPGDFLEEDYQKVLKLLKKQNSEKKRRRLTDALQEDRSSTEADLEHRKANKFASESNSGSASNYASDHRSSESSYSGEGSKSRGRRSPGNKGSEPSHSVENSNPTMKLKESNESRATKKRSLKQDRKMESDFKKFFGMIVSFNQTEATEKLAKDFTKDQPDYGTKVKGDICQIDTRKNVEVQKNEAQIILD